MSGCLSSHVRAHEQKTNDIDGESSSLCSICQTIPFDAKLETLSSLPDDQREWNFGTFGDLRRRSCPFCQLLTSTCTKDLSSWAPLDAPADSQETHVQYDDSGFRVRECSPLGSYVCMADTVLESNVNSARSEFPEWIDLDDVRRWISNCETKHASFAFTECTPATFDSSVFARNGKGHLVFRLIDVKDMCIVYASDRCRYIALSYVWGAKNQGRLVLSRENESALLQPGSLTISHNGASVPNTILDAITVTRRLGERYLWVDSLCLVQDKPTELDDCVAMMDLFYEMATITIIVAAGDAWAGIPGISPTPRQKTRLAKDIIPGLRMTTIMDVDTVLRRSVYSSRAWTMQEEVLSNRLLVFVNDQVYFNCPRNAYSEAMNWPGKELRGFQYSASLYSSIFAASSADFMDFSMLVQYYMSRQLTYPEDVLRAAQGMLRKYSTLSGMDCFEGLPCPLDQSLIFESATRPISKRFGRRSGFPTYSWTGWMQAPTYDRDPEDAATRVPIEDHESGPRSDWRCWITWHCRQPNGTFSRIGETGRLMGSSLAEATHKQCDVRRIFSGIETDDNQVNPEKLPPQPYPHLLFWTVCVKLNCRQQVNIDPQNSSSGIDYLEAFDSLGNICGTVTTDIKLADTSSPDFALILAGEYHFWALMLRWDNDVAERIGSARLSSTILENSLAPGPRWKHIVLG